MFDGEDRGEEEPRKWDETWYHFLGGCMPTPDGGEVFYDIYEQKGPPGCLISVCFISPIDSHFNMPKEFKKLNDVAHIDGIKIEYVRREAPGINKEQYDFNSHTWFEVDEKWIEEYFKWLDQQKQTSNPR